MKAQCIRCVRKTPGAVVLLLAAALLAACTADAESSPKLSPAAAGELSLPRIPWEGGPEYWSRFANASAGGWTDPGFFPVVAWHNGISSDAEVQYDKALGINTYIGMPPETQFSLFEDNQVFWIGDRLNESFDPQSPNWAGTFLDDEVDGRFSPQDGVRQLEARARQAPAGTFNLANFTQMVISTDLPAAEAENLVNGPTDVVSMDMYWYTVPHCSQEPYRSPYLVDISRPACRTASSYGRAVQALRMRDAADDSLQQIWHFVENLNGGPAEGTYSGYVEPGEVQGAVMSAVINEARGILYFNQSFSGDCQTSNVFRTSQMEPDFCGRGQVEAVREVNTRIHALAPVINTQSYEYSFGAGLDTMLKTHDGHAYVFAMVEGGTEPGERTFTLPEGTALGEVEVLFEDRVLAAEADGSFTDSFEQEYSYHLYRVPLDG
ncbi:hypothetical protein QMA10_11595 [Arthrobacter sp. APC 3897]|uniref:hypothetical protein n=1 Tax=Arthrobacter sp. APC 3897 TaxID=3035204 RepID=UPI0025B5DDBF|nr:hypothetical protein [Arthrobacter sp. APC 3897]MDN3482564.1 hypothetical protein [Arthrobacter sp. APC 3897]